LRYIAVYQTIMSFVERTAQLSVTNPAASQNTHDKSSPQPAHIFLGREATHHMAPQQTEAALGFAQ
jgi:hypothetical protein